MSRREYKLTEAGEKMVVDAFREMVNHGWPPPSYRGEGDEEGLVVLAGYIALSNGMQDLSGVMNKAGLTITERRQVLLAFAAIKIGFTLHDAPLLDEIAGYLWEAGLSPRLNPHFDFGDTSLEMIERQMNETLTDPAPEPMIQFAVECCDQPGEKCCESEEE